jgi:hypothetical protein
MPTAQEASSSTRSQQYVPPFPSSPSSANSPPPQLAVTTSASVSAAATGTTSSVSIPISSSAAVASTTTAALVVSSTTAGSSTTVPSSSASAPAASVSGKTAPAGWSCTFSLSVLVFRVSYLLTFPLKDGGCYSDLVSGKRALTALLSPTNWSVAACSNAAAGKYQFFGVEDGGECCES